MKISRISNRRNGFGEEDNMHFKFAAEMKTKILEKKICQNFVRFGYNTAGEYRPIKTAVTIKKKHGETGVADYLVEHRIDGIDHTVYLEFKAGKNKQSQSQIDFQNLYKDSKNSFYYVVYSVEEAINILIKHNIIIK
jgi:hypothetical protein